MNEGWQATAAPPLPGCDCQMCRQASYRQRDRGIPDQARVRPARPGREEVRTGYTPMNWNTFTEVAPFDESYFERVRQAMQDIGRAAESCTFAFTGTDGSEAWAAFADHVDPQAEERARQRKLADSRAREYLLSLLDEEQRDEYKKGGWATIRARSGRLYRVSGSGVKWVDEKGLDIESYCIQATDRHSNIPCDDIVAARLLLLQADEAKFLATANVIWRRQPERPAWSVVGGGITWLDGGVQARHASRFFRFTQDLANFDDNYGLPPNVRAVPERNSIVYEGQEYRIINQTVRDAGLDSRQITLEVELIVTPT